MFSFSLDLNVNKPSGQAGTYQVQTTATGLSKNFVLFLFIMFSFSLDVNVNPGRTSRSGNYRFRVIPVILWKQYSGRKIF